MRAKRNLGHVISSCLLVWGCGGGGKMSGAIEGEKADVPEAAWAVVAAAGAEPAGSLSDDEIQRLVYDFKHGQAPERQGDPLDHLRSLSPEDLRRFRVALADQSPTDGLLREMYDAYTDVLYEHRVFMLDAGPELLGEAVRRAFSKHSHEWGPEVVEQAVQHVMREGVPPHLQHPAP
jgi:hypothetical protein